MAQILSTLTSSFVFVKYAESVEGQLPVKLRRIRIAGGANTPTNKGFGDMSSDHRGTPMWTPSGMVTTVDDDDMKWLGEDRTFNQFVDAGLIQVMSEAGAEFKDNHKKLSREVRDNMSEADSHAPLKGNGDPRIQAKLKVSSGPIDSADNDNSNYI